MNTLREFVAMSVNTHEPMRGLGLLEDSVFSADTMDSITVRPFVVFRWLDQVESIGRNTVRPFVGWVYDDRGSFDRAERIGKEMARLLKSFEAVQLSGGYLLGIRGGLQGRDSYDEGYQAVAIPWSFTAVANCD